jgi:hypothetical protein
MGMVVIVVMVPTCQFRDKIVMGKRGCMVVLNKVVGPKFVVARF